MPAFVPTRRRSVPRRLSPTALKMYLDCPQRYAWRYLDGVAGRDDPSWDLALGKVVHEALRLFFGMPLTHRSEALLHDCARHVWRSNTEGLFSDREEERERGLDTLALLSHFHARFDPAIVPLAREVRAQARLANGIVLFGVIDRADVVGGGELDLIDYKTGWRLPDEHDMHEDLALQVYGLLAGAT